MKRCDEYEMLICNKTGGIAVYNPEKNLMMSPHADGPLRFNPPTDGGDPTLDRMTKFGRSFSKVRVPFAFKLLLQELQTMNIHMKIITADNINNLLTMNYSDNINKLMRNDDKLSNIMNQVNSEINKMTGRGEKVLPNKRLVPEPIIPPVPIDVNKSDEDSPPYVPGSDDSIPYDPGSDDSIPYAPGSDDSIPYAPGSPYMYSPRSPVMPPGSDDSIPYAPDSPQVYRPRSPSMPPPGTMNTEGALEEDAFLSDPVSNEDIPKVASSNELEMKNPYIQSQFDALNSKDKMKLVQAVAQVESERVEKETASSDAAMSASSSAPSPMVIHTPTVEMTQDTMGILKVDEPPADTNSDDDDDDKNDSENKSGGSVKKVVSFGNN